MVVDPDCTELENATGSPSPLNVACPDRGGQAIDPVVCFFQHFFLGLEAADDDNRAENLALHNLGVVAILRYDGRLEKETFFEAGNAGALTAHNDVRAIAQGTFYKT